VVLPITDPYVVHHGALGSFAWIHVPENALKRVHQTIAAVNGVEEVYTREEAAVIFEHPIDRIGDLSVTANADTVLGKSLKKHDLSGIDSGGLRSHGGRHEQIVPIILSRPLREPYARRFAAGATNADMHDFLLNGSVIP
jgi:phosphonoacetate hydrolase